MNVISKDAVEVISHGYKELSKYTIKTRTYASSVDGLKAVYRRVLYASLPYRKLVKSARIVGDTIGRYHPHSDGSAYGVLVSLASKAYSNYPLYTVSGNWGSAQFGPAAMRYTECVLSEFGRCIIGESLIPYSNFVDGEIGEEEPENLPMLLPYSLLVGGSGMGVGMPNPSIPPLNALQLLEYYKSYISTGKFDKSKFPMIDVGDCILWGTDEDVINVLETGSGSVWYSGIVIQEGDSFKVTSFTPGSSISRVLKKLDWYIERDYVSYINESAMEHRHIFKLEVSNEWIDMDKLKTIIKKSLQCKVSYKIITQDKSVAYISSVQHIIDKNIKYLKECVVRKANKVLSKCEKDKLVIQAIQLLKKDDCISKFVNKPIESMINYLVSRGIEEEIAKVAVSKSISYLSSNKHLDEITKITDIITEYEEYRDHPEKYLSKEYDRLEPLLKELYDSGHHTIVSSDPDSVSTITKFRLYENSIYLSNKLRKPNAQHFNSQVILFNEEGVPYKRHFSERYEVTKSYSDLDIESKVIGACTDLDMAVILVEDNKYLSCRYLDNIFDNKSFINLEGKVTNIYPVTSKSILVTTNTNRVIELSIDNLVKSRKSKSIGVGVPDNEYIVSITDK